MKTNTFFEDKGKYVRLYVTMTNVVSNTDQWLAHATPVVERVEKTQLQDFSNLALKDRIDLINKNLLSLNALYQDMPPLLITDELLALSRRINGMKSILNLCLEACYKEQKQEQIEDNAMQRVNALVQENSLVNQIAQMNISENQRWQPQ